MSLPMHAEAMVSEIKKLLSLGITRMMRAMDGHY